MFHRTSDGVNVEPFVDIFKSLVNELPSEMKVFGNSNLKTMFFHINAWTLLAVIEAKGLTSIHLVK